MPPSLETPLQTPLAGEPDPIVVASEARAPDEPDGPAVPLDAVDCLEAATPAPRRVLHVGCGAYAASRLHAVFRKAGWKETRLDINAEVRPDIVCSIHDMSSAVEARAYDALWSSHNIEHLHQHEVAAAFGEFHRVLKNDGFALMRCPDLEAVAEALLREGADHTVYLSPAGPITPLDMLYGHGASIANGNAFMRHHTGFTAERLGRMLLDAGFGEVHTKRTADYELWAAAFMPEAAPSSVLRALASCNLKLDA